MPQAIRQGSSIPKVVRMNADDKEAVVYRNLGNGHRVPMLWGKEITLASGTSEVVVSSGVTYNNFKVADGKVVATPLSAVAAGLTTYIDKDSINNVVTFKATAAASADCKFDILVFLGDQATV